MTSPALDDLKTKPASWIVWKAKLELRVALAQSHPDLDDRIIMGHIQQALDFLDCIEGS